jgi:hypothetical protein
MELKREKCVPLTQLFSLCRDIVINVKTVAQVFVGLLFLKSFPKVIA